MVVEMDHNMPVDCWVFEHFLNGFFSQKHEQLGLNGFPHKTSQSYSHVRSPSLCRWSCDEKLVAPGCLLQMNLAECHRGFRSVPRQESCRQRCHIPLSGRWATWFMSHLGSLGPSEWPLADLGPKNSGTNMDQHGPIWTNMDQWFPRNTNITRAERSVWARHLSTGRWGEYAVSEDLSFGMFHRVPMILSYLKTLKVWKSGKVNVDGVTPWQTAISLFQKDILVFAKHLGSDTALFPCGHVPTVLRW